MYSKKHLTKIAFNVYDRTDAEDYVNATVEIIKKAQAGDYKDVGPSKSKAKTDHPNARIIAIETTHGRFIGAADNGFILSIYDEDWAYGRSTYKAAADAA